MLNDSNYGPPNTGTGWVDIPMMELADRRVGNQLVWSHASISKQAYFRDKLNGVDVLCT